MRNRSYLRYYNRYRYFEYWKRFARNFYPMVMGITKSPDATVHENFHEISQWVLRGPRSYLGVNHIFDSAW